MLIIFKAIQVFGCRHRVQAALPNMLCMWDFRVVKARTWIRRASSVHSGLTTPMSIADVVLVALCVYAGGA